jgi:hypothetical protein
MLCLPGEPRLLVERVGRSFGVVVDRLGDTIDRLKESLVPYVTSYYPILAKSSV